MPAPVLLVVDATMQRADEDFTGRLERLSLSLISTAGTAGWEPRRVAIGDVADEEIGAVEDAADAIVIMGGEDIDPTLYGKTADYTNSLHRFESLADRRSVALIRRTAANRTPLLGICRGMQLINVAHGGTLIQHLDNADDHGLDSSTNGDSRFVPHPVTITTGTRLCGTLGPTAATQSSHHQAVERAGGGLVVAARAGDGTVEAVEHEWAPQVGVQWHPEAPAADPADLVRLLAALRNGH